MTSDTIVSTFSLNLRTKVRNAATRVVSVTGVTCAVFVSTIPFHWGLFYFKLSKSVIIRKNVKAKRTGRCVIVYIVTAVECF